MALGRHRKPKSSIKSRAPREKPFSFAAAARADVAAKIERARQRRKAERAAGRIPSDMVHRAGERERADARKHGFKVTREGVVADRPRDVRRDVIPGSRVEVLRGGVVKTQIGTRYDFIYGFTPEEREAFARNPEQVTNEILDRMIARFPIMRRVPRSRIQVRLQWGAYQGTKDFSPDYFTHQYFTTASDEEKRRARKGRRRAEPRVDKLTGLHFVVHIPAASTARKRKGSKKNAKSRRR